MPQQEVSDSPALRGHVDADKHSASLEGVAAARPAILDRLLALAHVDWSPRHRQPTVMRVAIATVITIGAALLADALLVAAGTHVFTATRGYDHFRFNDYAKLTIIGVLIGCMGWPVLTRISSAPRWLYGWLTILATLALFLPDGWLLLRSQPPKAVAVLMTMHVAVALVIYVVMVSIAPVRKAADRGDVSAQR
jgi:hypothetical protein